MWQNTRVKWHPRWSDCWPAVVCNPIWWEMLVGGQSITSLMHNTACWKSIWDSKANFHVTWGFFFFFSAPIYRDIVGFYWAPFIKISLKTFLEVKTPPLYTYMLCIWKMHFNHWWVNKVLWWRPNMVIVKIKKKTIWSGTATFIMHHRTLFILFWLDCVLTKNEEKLVLKKNSICWNHPYKHRYICYKYSSPPRETIGQRNWFCSVFSAHRS